MPLIVGVLLALVVGLFATGVGLDRDRAFYTTVTIVVASYYALFAVMGASNTTLVLELVAGAVFLIGAVAGRRWSMWIVAAALAGHGVFDSFHGHLIANPGVPPWWPPFCGAYDVTAGAYLAWRLASGRVRSGA